MTRLCRRFSMEVSSFSTTPTPTESLSIAFKTKAWLSHCAVLCSQQRAIPVVEARCMDEICEALAEHLLPAIALYANAKHIVGLRGPPRAGKCTLAYEVVQRINKIWPQKASSFDSQVTPPDVATVLPMDGFHLYCSQLDAMEDPKEAHSRRGGEAHSRRGGEVPILDISDLKLNGNLQFTSFPW